MTWARKLLLGTASAIGGTALAGGIWYRSVTGGESHPAGYYANSPSYARFNRGARMPEDCQLTLFQYQTCPFCCKVRAYLDYRGLKYNVVEVNSVTREQIRWCQDYRKVPILLCQGTEGDDEKKQVILKDSSVIVSALESQIRDPTQSLSHLLTCYPGIVGEADAKVTHPNRHFVMQPNGRRPSDERLRNEAKWRDWADNVFVHTISPNIYRSLSESVRTFRWFEEAGRWRELFTWHERLVIVYVGAVAMRIVGVRLRNKYNLQQDVRQDLYNELNAFLHSVGSKKFRGGQSPDLSDLALYGMLTAMRGTDAFEDAVRNCGRLGQWYERVHTAVAQSEGCGALLKAK